MKFAHFVVVSALINILFISGSCTGSNSNVQVDNEQGSPFVKVDGRVFRDPMDRELILNGINLIDKESGEVLAEGFSPGLAASSNCTSSPFSPATSASRAAVAQEKFPVSCETIVTWKAGTSDETAGANAPAVTIKAKRNGPGLTRHRSNTAVRFSYRL